MEKGNRTTAFWSHTVFEELNDKVTLSHVMHQKALKELQSFRTVDNNNNLPKSQETLRRKHPQMVSFILLTQEVGQKFMHQFQSLKNYPLGHHEELFVREAR